MPNTRFANVTLRVVARPVVTWIAPRPNACLAKSARLFVAASSARAIRSVRFVDAARTIGVVARPALGVARLTWNTGLLRAGPHRVAAVAVDVAGRTASASRIVRVCR
jgi:hypothetical protein